MPSQTLSLSQSQQLQMVLAPQLRQSLEMLQAPVLELRAMIRQEIEQNPTIEEVPLDQASVEIEPDANANTDDSKELEFEKEFDIQIPDDQAENIATVGQAISYIEEAK